MLRQLKKSFCEKSFPKHSLIGGLLLVSLSHCGSGVGEGAPLWLLDFRQADSGDVALNEELYFEFSEPLDRASIHEGTIRVKDLEGTSVEGELLTEGSKVVVFVPSLPREADLTDGGFRPGTRYQVTLAGFPRVDGIRSARGELLSQSLVYSFETATDAENESVFFGFPGGQGRFDLDRTVHRPGAELGTLDPIRIVCDRALDPTTLNPDDFTLLALKREGEGEEEYGEIDLRVSIIENQRDRAVIELSAVSDAAGVGGLRALDPGEYLLIYGSKGRDFGAGMQLKTLDGARVVPAWPGFRTELWVRDRLRELDIDFSDRSRLWSGRPEESDATARWGMGSRGGVSIRYPRAAGDGHGGEGVFGTGPRWGRALPRPNGSVGERSVFFEVPPEGLDVHGVRVKVPDGTALELLDQGGLFLLRSQGALTIHGRLERKRNQLEPPSTDPKGNSNPKSPYEELFGLESKLRSQWPSLTAWLAQAEASGEVGTVLIAGGELEVFGQIDVEGPLVLVAGGEVRIPGSVKAGSRSGDERFWWQTSQTLLPLRKGARLLPLRIDPPVENALLEPLRFSVRSRFFRAPGSVGLWGSAGFEGTQGMGRWAVSFFGKRLRNGRLESFGPVSNLTLLQDCPEISFRVDLELLPGNSRWAPPRLDSLTLTWSEGLRVGGSN